jgi:CheY-like chemotaxis protein
MVASNKRVLVMDDEAIVCESYKIVLTDAGYSVHTAKSGREALAACRDEPFDVLLADLRMPDMDGLDVTRTVRKEFPQVQVLIITGYPTSQSAEEARRLGVFDYLCKPLTPERLSAVTAAAAASPAEGMMPAGASAEPAPEEPVQSVPPSAEPEEAKPEETEPQTVPAVAQESILKTLGVVAIAPLIGLAYVLLLPLIGFGMLLAAMGAGLAKKLGGVKS